MSLTFMEYALRVVELIILIDIILLIFFFYRKDRDSRKLILLLGFIFLYFGHFSDFIHYNFAYSTAILLNFLHYSTIGFTITIILVLMKYLKPDMDTGKILKAQLVFFAALTIFAIIFTNTNVIALSSILGICTIFLFILAGYIYYNTKEKVMIFLIFSLLMFTLAGMLGVHEHLAATLGRIGGYLFLISISLLPAGSDDKNSFANMFQHHQTLDETKQKLIESEKKYMTLVHRSPFGIVTFNDFNVLFSNKQFRKLSGLDPNKMIDTSYMSKMIPGLSKELEAYKSTLSSNSRVGTKQFDTIIKRKNGVRIPVEVILNQIKYLGRPVNMIFIQDISERKKLQRSLVSAKEEAEFYTDILSHDLLNYNQGVMGMMEFSMMDTDIKPRTRELMQKAMNHLGKSSNLIMRVRELNRIKSSSPTRKHLDLKELITKSAEDVKLAHPDIDIKVNYIFPDKSYQITGDELLHDLFTNLISNAVNYDDQPTKVIDIVLNDGGKGDLGATTVQVIDRGCGIPDVEKEKIFRRFKRLKRSKEGTGLGLSIAREIVDKYNGIIWVEDRVPGKYDEGTIFNVLFPNNN